MVKFDGENYNEVYKSFVETADYASKGLEDTECRYIAFEKVLDDLLAGFFDQTYKFDGKGE